MKNRSVLFLLFIAILLVQPLHMETANAQSPDKIDFYVDVGPGIPAAPTNFTQNWNVGYGIGGGVSYEIRPSVKLQLYGQYHRFSFDKSGAREGVNIPETITGIDGAEAEVFNVMLNAIYEYPLPGVPTLTYISIGSGFFRSVRSDFEITTEQQTIPFNQRTESTLGVNGALGLRHALVKLFLFTQKPNSLPVYLLIGERSIFR